MSEGPRSRPVGLYVRLTDAEKKLVGEAAAKKSLSATEFVRRSVLFDAAAVFEFESAAFAAYEAENGGEPPAWWPGIENQALFEGMHWFLMMFPPEVLEAVSQRCFEETGKDDLRAWVLKLMLEKKE